MGKQWKQWQKLFWGVAPKSLQMVTAAMKFKSHLFLGRKAMTNLDCVLKRRDIPLPTEVYIVKAMVFPAVMYGCESWTIRKAECQKIDAFELWCWKRLESLMDSKEVKPVNLKGSQPWIFIGRTDAEAEAPILWPPNAKSRLIGKDPEAGKEWGQEKRATEDGKIASLTQ